MSVAAMAWAWRQADLTSTEAFVLVALADHSDHHGICWPGQEGIAEKCKLARPTVSKAIKTLEAKGKLTVERRTDHLGRPLSNRYRLSLKEGGNVTDDDIGHVTDDYTNPSQDDVNHQSESSGREPSKEIINPSSDTQSDSGAWDPADLWLRQFLESEQKTFDGARLSRLLVADFWVDLSEAINGLTLSFVRGEFARMSMWLRDNPARAPTDKGVRRFVSTWLQKAAEKRRLSNGSTAQTRFANQ